jgi:hypothetical protein
MTDFICKHCAKELATKRSWAAHQPICPKNENRTYKNGMEGKTGELYPRQNYSPWNTGLSKEELKAHYSEEAWNAMFNKVDRTHSEATKELMSIKACQRLAKNSKYSKNIEYKPGVILESSYEVRVAEILDTLGIEWEKVRKGYIWNDAGKKRRYIPDFYIPQFDLFLDPKNDYLIGIDTVKIKSAMELNDIQVVVLSDAQINIEFISKLFAITLK